MSKTKRIFLTIMALVLVCVISVTGTMAYLQASTGVLNNTFAMGGLFPGDGGLELKEHKATEKTGTSGEYELSTTEEVTDNNYSNIIPGQSVPKDPFVRYTKLSANAYLYMGVSANMGTLTYTLSDNWMQLKNGTTPVTKTVGSVTYNIYVYCNGGSAAVIVPPNTSAQTIQILDPQTITVPTDFQSSSTLSLSFTAYMCQSTGFTDALAAFNACFATT